MAAVSAGQVVAGRAGVRSRLFHRDLDTYPENGQRLAYLGLVVLITIALYFMAYCGGSVTTLLMADLHMTFLYFVVLTAIGNVIGAFGAYFAGMTDRIGRANTVVVGLTAASLLTLFALPNAHNRWVFGFLALLVGNIEGIVLVGTPALIRDFSPQLGRARAMGFWTLGPVIGSLIVAVVGTLTIHGTPPAGFWTHEYVIAGSAGLAVSVLAIVFLRELAPGLRDQLMVSMADRALVEARAKGIDVEASMRQPFRQMLKPDIVISGFAVSVLLLAYYTAVGFGVVIFETVFGFSLHQANALGNWTWGINALTVVLVGLLSDRLRVRKPFMIVGATIAAVTLVLYLEQFGGHPSFTQVALLVSIVSFGLGVAYTPWMASFTETVEARNPALTATGLAVWGLTLRVVVFVSFMVFPAIITTVTPLVNFAVNANGYTTALTFASTHQALVVQVSNPANASQLAELAALEKADPADMAAVQANGGSLSTLSRFSPEVSAVAAHPALFSQLAKDPTSSTLQAQAVAALGGGQTGSQRLATLAANSSTIVPALTYAEAHPLVVAFATANAGPLTWAAGHSALVAEATRYSAELTALAETPSKVLAYATSHAAAAAKAQAQTPSQWRIWYWVCFGGAVVFLLCVPLLRGRWSPKRARQDAEEHDVQLRAEMESLVLMDS